MSLPLIKAGGMSLNLVNWHLFTTFKVLMPLAEECHSGGYYLGWRTEHYHSRGIVLPEALESLS